ncbi:hypothetical protein GCM10023310_10880 [Paenibacillus vulneris]
MGVELNAGSGAGDGSTASCFTGFCPHPAKKMIIKITTIAAYLLIHSTHLIMSINL